MCNLRIAIPLSSITYIIIVAIGKKFAAQVLSLGLKYVIEFTYCPVYNLE
jgi:hypothetical protein